MKKITLFALTAFIIFGCKTEKVTVKNPYFVQAEAGAAKIAATTSSDSCNCLWQAPTPPCTADPRNCKFFG